LPTAAAESLTCAVNGAGNCVRSIGTLVTEGTVVNVSCCTFASTRMLARRCHVGGCDRWQEVQARSPRSWSRCWNAPRGWTGRNARLLSAYAGIVPSVHQSGESTRSGPITKERSSFALVTGRAGSPKPIRGQAEPQDSPGPAPVTNRSARGSSRDQGSCRPRLAHARHRSYRAGNRVDGRVRDVRGSGPPEARPCSER
jgi:hypothetical protein